jgi:hypothetical protein
VVAAGEEAMEVVIIILWVLKGMMGIIIIMGWKNITRKWFSKIQGIHYF